MNKSTSSTICANATNASAPSPRLLNLAVAFVVTALFLICTVYYMLWRFVATSWEFWWIGLPLLLAELFGVLNTLGLQYTVWPRSPQPLDACLDPSHLPIYIMIPTVNEGIGVLEPTVRGALAARACYLSIYPQSSVTIVVCNDGRVAGVPNWTEVETLADRLFVACITRTVPGGAKAGNIEYARQLIGATGNALIAIFDADMVAEPEFLIKTVPPFADPRMGWVQTGQYYRNQDNAVARWAHDQQILFYQLICLGKATVNGAFICGTNVVLRASALDTIGGLPQNSVTEDLAASILLHPKWRSVYLTDVLAQGLGPEDLSSYFSQQRRWATGTFGVLFRQWRVMLLPWHRGLTLPQRLQYLYCCLHFFSGARDLICLVAPLIFLLFGIPALRVFSFSAFLAHFVPFWIASTFVFWYAVRGKTSFRAILHGSILSFSCSPIFVSAFLTALTGKRLKFVITAKQRQVEGSLQHLTPQMLMLLACIIGLCQFAFAEDRRWLGLVSELWLLYLAVLICGMLWLGIAQNPAMEQRYVSIGRRFSPVAICLFVILAGWLVSYGVLVKAASLHETRAAYTITDIGTLGGVSIFHGGGSINNLGQAVGASQTHDFTEGNRAFLWTDGNIQDLGVLPGGRRSVAYGINDRGQVVGFSDNASGGERAFLWEGGHMRDLETLPGFRCSVATAINNRGQVVGRAYNPPSGDLDVLLWPSHAFLWESGKMRDLGVPPGYKSSRAYGINEQGQVVGWAGTADGTRKAFVWQAGKMIKLAGSSKISAATGINNAGEIVGVEGYSRDTMHAVVWTSGKIHDLGTILGHTFNKGSAINSSGQVVGEARNLTVDVPLPTWDPTGERSMLGEATPPFVWDAKHGMRSLSSLIPSRSGWYLLQVFGVNDRGQILAWGQYKNQERACLLTPNSAVEAQ